MFTSKTLFWVFISSCETHSLLTYETQTNAVGQSLFRSQLCNELIRNLLQYDWLVEPCADKVSGAWLAGCNTMQYNRSAITMKQYNRSTIIMKQIQYNRSSIIMNSQREVPTYRQHYFTSVHRGTHTGSMSTEIILFSN